jgi:hypothetical protein
MECLTQLQVYALHLRKARRQDQDHHGQDPVERHSVERHSGKAGTIPGSGQAGPPGPISGRDSPSLRHTRGPGDSRHTRGPGHAHSPSLAAVDPAMGALQELLAGATMLLTRCVCVRVRVCMWVRVCARVCVRAFVCVRSARARACVYCVMYV